MRGIEITEICRKVRIEFPCLASAIVNAPCEFCSQGDTDVAMLSRRTLIYLTDQDSRIILLNGFPTSVRN